MPGGGKASCDLKDKSYMLRTEKLGHWWEPSTTIPPLDWLPLGFLLFESEKINTKTFLFGYVTLIGFPPNETKCNPK